MYIYNNVLELNISFDVLLECFSNFFRNVHDSCFSTGQHWQKCTGWDPCVEWVENHRSLTEPCRTRMFFLPQLCFIPHASVYNAVSTLEHLYSQYVVHGSILEEHQNTFATTSLLNIRLAHYCSGNWKCAGTVAHHCTYSMLHV